MIIPFDGGTFSRYSDDWLDYEESPMMVLLDVACKLCIRFLDGGI